MPAPSYSAPRRGECARCRAPMPRIPAARAKWARQEGLMTKADIVDEIAERTGLTKKDVADTVDQFLDAVSRALASGKHIEIRGFGTFKVKDRKSRLARNPRTGESVPVPPRRVPVFKVSKELKDIVAQI